MKDILQPYKGFFLFATIFSDRKKQKKRISAVMTFFLEEYRLTQRFTGTTMRAFFTGHQLATNIFL